MKTLAVLMLVSIFFTIDSPCTKNVITEIQRKDDCGQTNVHIRVFGGGEDRIDCDPGSDVVKSIKSQLFERYGNHNISKLLYDSIIDSLMYNQIYAEFYDSLDNSRLSLFNSTDLDSLETFFPILLEDVYFFGNNPDVYIAKFMTLPSTFFGGMVCRNFVYLINNDSLILMDRKDEKMIHLEEAFNYIYENSEDLKNLDPVCKAALVLFMKYRFNTVYIIESYEDMGKADAIGRAPYEGVSKEIIAKKEMFFTNLSNIDDWFKDWKKYEKINVNDLKSAINFHAPTINRNTEEDIVNLTIFTNYNAEIAEWDVVFYKDGKLKSLNYTKEPVSLYGSIAYSSPYRMDRIKK